MKTMALKLNGIFGTSHGKSHCDGIGGSTKQLVARASLQATENNQILNPNQMFQCPTRNIVGIIFFLHER